MQIDESLENIGDQRGDEHMVQVQVVVIQHVIETATGAVGSQNSHGIRFDGRPNEGYDVLVAQFPHLLQFLANAPCNIHRPLVNPLNGHDVPTVQTDRSECPF